MIDNAPRPVDPTAAGPLRLYAAADSARLDRDPNGFLLNPGWLGTDTISPPNIEKRCRFRVLVGHLETRRLLTTEGGCLSDEERRLVSLNEVRPSLGMGSVCVTGSKTGALQGHINWFPVTVTGLLRWNSFSKDPGDHDINIDLIPPARSAVTRGNKKFSEYSQQRGYHTESYFDEILLHLNQSDGFWAALKGAHENDTSAAKLVSKRFAIVTGIFGLDGVHGYHAELHPVYAMSVLVDTAWMAPNTLREEWAIMFRNTGSEGDCAEGTVPLLATATDSLQQDFIIDIGRVVGQGRPKVARSIGSTTDTRSGVLTAWVDDSVPADTSHLYLKFHHPRPRPGEPGYMFAGTIIVEWSGANRATWGARRFGGLIPEANFGVKIERVPDRNSLVRTPEAGLTAIEFAEMKRFGGVHVYNAAPWQLPSKVETAECTSKGRHKGEHLCYGTTRWVIGGSTRGTESAFLPMVAHYRFPHHRYDEETSAWVTVKNIFWTFGSRTDVRMERFVARSGTRDAAAAAPTRCWPESLYEATTARCGVSLRWSPFLAPSKVRLSERIAFIPYTISNLGVSWINRPKALWYHGFQGTSGWGIGLLIQPGSHDIFFETQRMKRWDSTYESRWAGTVGYMLPFWRGR